MVRVSGQPQWVKKEANSPAPVKKEANSPASTGEGDVDVVLDCQSERPHSAFEGAKSQSSAGGDASEAFPPLLCAPDAGVAALDASTQRLEGLPTSDSQVDSWVAAETSEQTLFSEINKLKHELEGTKQREASHRSNAVKLRHDVQRCSMQAAAVAKEETRLLSEVSAARFRGGGQREAVRTHNVEITGKIADYARRAADHEQRQRGWREELESMSRQHAKAADHVEELQRANASLKATAEQQITCLSKAEARVKRLESRRAGLKTEAQKLQQQLKVQLEGKCCGNSTDEASPVVQTTSGGVKAPGQTKGRSPENQMKAPVLHSAAHGAPALTENLLVVAIAVVLALLAFAFSLFTRFNAE